MSITERLANLTIPQVLIIVAVLAVIRLLLPKLKTPWAKSIAEIAESLAVAMALVFLLIRPFLVQAFFIPSASMHPTLLEQDHILVNKLVYRIGEPKRGDIVVFKAPYWAENPGMISSLQNEAAAEADRQGLTGAAREEFIRFGFDAKNEKDFIKRVVAIPGDTVRITAGRVFVGSDEYDHVALRVLLEKLSTVKIEGGRVYEDGKELSNWELGAIAGRPGTRVEITSDPVTGGIIKIGNDFDIQRLLIGEANLSEFMAGRHRVKLVDGKVYRDGELVAPAKIAELAGKKGAKVKVVSGVVYRNGKAIVEPFTAEDPDSNYPIVSGDRATPDSSAFVTVKGELWVKIPPGKLLVMGDNRNDSNDARFWGLLDRRRVLGKAMFTFWPLTRIGLVR